MAGLAPYNVSLTYLPSSVANLIVSLEPAFTTVTAYLLFGERLTAVQLGGSAMILGAVAFMRVYEGWLERQTPPGRQPGTEAAATE